MTRLSDNAEQGDTKGGAHRAGDHKELRRLLVPLGATLMTLGIGLLLYLTVLVVLAFEAPERVAIVQFVLEQVNGDDRAFYGQLGGEPFELHISGPMRQVLFLALGIMIAGAFASLVRALISVGLWILRAGLDRPGLGRASGLRVSTRRRSGPRGAKVQLR